MEKIFKFWKDVEYYTKNNNKKKKNIVIGAGSSGPSAKWNYNNFPHNQIFQFRIPITFLGYRFIV